MLPFDPLREFDRLTRAALTAVLLVPAVLIGVVRPRAEFLVAPGLTDESPEDVTVDQPAYETESLCTVIDISSRRRSTLGLPRSVQR